jgi:hypothetical protein
MGRNQGWMVRVGLYDELLHTMASDQPALGARSVIIDGRRAVVDCDSAWNKDPVLGVIGVQ